MLAVEGMPELQRPVLVYHFTGWVDAGGAGAGAIEFVAEHLSSSQTFARYDLAELVDLQQTRPTVRLVDGGARTIDWPEMTFTAGNVGRDVVLAIGPEPSIHWRRFTQELVELARNIGIVEAYGLAGMPSMVSHRRPYSALATATSTGLAQEVGALRTDYHGPTGIQTVFQVALGDAGIPTVGLWAQAPHYLAAYPSPPAVRSLLERLRDLARLALDLRDLDTRCEEYTTRVEEGIADRPDVLEIVRSIEAQQPDLPTGDELASEIERFLRNQ